MVASDAQAACDDPKPPCLPVRRVICRLPPLCGSALCTRMIVAVAPVLSSLASSAWTDMVEIRVDRGVDGWLQHLPKRTAPPTSLETLSYFLFSVRSERTCRLVPVLPTVPRSNVHVNVMEKCAYVGKRRPRAYTDLWPFCRTGTSMPPLPELRGVKPSRMVAYYGIVSPGQVPPLH